VNFELRTGPMIFVPFLGTFGEVARDDDDDDDDGESDDTGGISDSVRDLRTKNASEGCEYQVRKLREKNLFDASESSVAAEFALQQSEIFMCSCCVLFLELCETKHYLQAMAASVVV
jgi:hypothetical protein